MASRQKKVWILTTNFRLTSASQSKGGETHMLVKDSLRMLTKDSLRMVCSKINTFLSIWDLLGIQNFTPQAVKIHGNKCPFFWWRTEALPTKVLDCPLDVIHIGDVKLSFRMEFEHGYGIHIFNQRFSEVSHTHTHTPGNAGLLFFPAQIGNMVQSSWVWTSRSIAAGLWVMSRFGSCRARGTSKCKSSLFHSANFNREVVSGICQSRRTCASYHESVKSFSFHTSWVPKTCQCAIPTQTDLWKLEGPEDSIAMLGLQASGLQLFCVVGDGDYEVTSVGHHWASNLHWNLGEGIHQHPQM